MTGPELLPYVRIVGPTIWALTAVGTIYLGCAAFDVYQDVKRLPPQKKREGLTFDEFERTALLGTRHRESHSSEPLNPASPLSIFGRLDSSGKAIATLSCLNIGSGALSRFPSLQEGFRYIQTFLHVPGLATNYTLLTSVFSRESSSFLGLGLNLCSIMYFGGLLAREPILDNNGSHFMSFYLSSGVLSCLFSHLSSAVWPNRGNRYMLTGGAWGPVCAILGGLALSRPDDLIWSIPDAKYLTLMDDLKIWACIETVGFFGGLRMLALWGFGWNYARNLAGLGIGAAYVHYDGKKKIWEPSRRIAFNNMKRLQLI